MAETYLGVTDEHELGVGASLVERVDLGGNGGGSLEGRVSVGDSAAGGLSTAGWVGDGLGGGAWEGSLDEVDDDTGGSVAWGDGGLSGSEDVDLWAVLGKCLESKGQNGGGGELELHGGRWKSVERSVVMERREVQVGKE